MTAQQPQMTVDQMVDYYVKLRAKIKEEDDAHKEKMRAKRDALEKLEGMLLQAVQATGGDSITCKGIGTVYKTVKKSATIADGDAFRRHVIGTQDFDLLDWRANVTAVEAAITRDLEPPPGINFSSFVTVNIRKG